MTAEDLRPAFRRVAFGDVHLTLLSDGRVVSGPPSMTHPDVDPQEMAAFLDGHGLPQDRLDLCSSILLLEWSGRCVLFDTGLGRHPGRPAWAQGAGRLAQSLGAAGIDPGQIDTVLLTHAHCDHTGGLTDAEGRPSFPAAEIVLARAEYEHWTDEGLASTRWRFDHELALRCLGGQAERLRFVAGDEGVCPNIRAIASPGHSVGHLSYLFVTDQVSFMVLGDVARHHLLNLRRPDWRFAGDFDSDQTVATRRNLLDHVAAQGLLAHSYHFPEGGFGMIDKIGDVYAFTPWHRRC